MGEDHRWLGSTIVHSTSFSSPILTDGEAEDRSAHHTSKLDILCKQHNFLRRTSFSLSLDLCRLRTPLLMSKPWDQANWRMSDSWYEDSSATSWLVILAVTKPTTPTGMALTQGTMSPSNPTQQMFQAVWRHVWLSHVGRALLTSGGEKTGLLLNILQQAGVSLTIKTDLATKVGSVEAERPCPRALTSQHWAL